LLLSEVPSRGGVVDLGINVVVARDARGLYAFSAVCPHEGCVVRITRGASTLCPCHDSTFDDDGDWTGGPARRPLLNHPVQVCEGRVYVDRSLGIPLGTRTPV
jgi:Rieske Fe-S protein